MSAGQLAENHARLHVELQDVIAFFEQEVGENGRVQQHSIDLLNSFIEKQLYTNFLQLVEGYGKAMAFIDHEELVLKLNKSYTLLLDGYIIEKKMARKKLNLIKEDKKADPEVLAKNEKTVADIEQKIAVAKVEFSRLKAMARVPGETFKDPNFDFKQWYKEEKEAIARKASLLDAKAAYLASKAASG